MPDKSQKVVPLGTSATLKANHERQEGSNETPDERRGTLADA